MRAAMRVEIIAAWPRRSVGVALEMHEGATVAEAVAASGLIDDALARELDGYAVFGERVEPETLLCEGDRVELLRPLQIDPKQARRRRERRSNDQTPRYLTT